MSLPLAQVVLPLSFESGRCHHPAQGWIGKGRSETGMQCGPGHVSRHLARSVRKPTSAIFVRFNPRRGRFQACAGISEGVAVGCTWNGRRCRGRVAGTVGVALGVESHRVSVPVGVG